MIPQLGQRALASLRTEDVDRLIADLEAKGKAAGTVRNVIVPLRKMLADAVRQGLILANLAVRTVPLFPSVDAALRELSAGAVERGRYAPDQLVFGSMRGTPLQPSNFRQRVSDPALRLARLDTEGHRFHDLRHTCVSRLVAAGADVKLVQAVAGHANPLTTPKRYSDLLDARVTEAAGRFDPSRIP